MVKPWQLENESPSPEDLAPYIGREIDLLYELPYRRDDAAAVYFVFDYCELIYVGSSAQICNRLNYWVRDKHHGRKHWTQIGVMLVPAGIQFTVEAHYIDRFRPRDNIEGKTA